MLTESPTAFLKSEEQVAYFALTNPHKRATIDSMARKLKIPITSKTQLVTTKTIEPGQMIDDTNSIKVLKVTKK